MLPVYIQGSDLPDLGLEWRDANGSIIDYSSGHTFVVKVGVPGSTALITKSTGITGAATAPNVTITWATSGELNTLTPGIYDADVAATRVADSKQRFMRFQIRVDAAIA